VDLETRSSASSTRSAPLDREANERERVRALVEERGLIAYRDYFPRARALQRELVLYAGPTNSGKTWRALNDLVAGESGAYLAPLRLLALEGQEEIEKRGRVASFVTGEERDIREGASFVASTIEMMDTQRVVDAVVIDEIQLLTDEDRGWAWCQALVGAPAKRVIMTGSPDCIPLVRRWPSTSASRSRITGWSGTRRSRRSRARCRCTASSRAPR
jgi:ATP-dependent RNA helicase SUPV3L1/SUV3